MNDSDKIESGVTRELEITDESLIHLLGDAIGTYPGVNFDSGLVVIPSPFSAIVRNSLSSRQSLLRPSFNIDT